VLTPLVSICVPNLNTVSFLQERFESIFQQTFQDWELFVYDSYSEDGSWELIQSLAGKEKRMRIAQGFSEGPYPAWNECLRRTTGKYVYIATSDDSMSPDFLEKMVAALERHPDCDLAHAPLVIVDETGARINGNNWPSCTTFADGLGDLHKVPHIRRAPYDGLLHLTARHSVLSITQLLIRRSIFSRIGNFSNRWGSVSDFNWEMKAGLVADTVHIPDTWATWRLHANQISAGIDVSSKDYCRKFEEMIDDALLNCQAYLPFPVIAALKSGVFNEAKDMRNFYASLRQRRERLMSRRLFQVSQFCRGSKIVRNELVGQMFGKPKWLERFPIQTRALLESLGHEPLACSDSANSFPAAI